MVRPSRTREIILSNLKDGKPKSHRDIKKVTKLSNAAVVNGLLRCWTSGFVLRTKEPIYEAEKVFKGRGGQSANTRAYHLYVLKGGKDATTIDDKQFVGFSKENLDARGGRGFSKARLILNFIQENKNKAWYSKEIADALKDRGVRICDIMSNVNRFEKKGLVYIRGYRAHDRQTPFRNGYLIVWIEQDKPRDAAIEEAIERTSATLDQRSSTNSVMQRVHSVRDAIIESTKLKDLVSFSFIQDKLGCTEFETETAVSRTLQLYPDLRGVKLFGVYKYYYHISMEEPDYKAAITMKQNYIRLTKGQYNRIGHNWEAVPEWFIDRFTTGAKFWMQEHRIGGMDSRRITIHLIKSIRGRINNAEVDRVWEVTPGLFAQPITYVLSCKWGLVRKRDVDDFLDVLKWSKDFGVDTPDGRQIKQGIIGIFAGSAFKPNEKIRLKGENEISLGTYASRMNIQLLKASDFNQKLQERGFSKEVTVQRICRISKDEKEVRELLETIWDNTMRSEEILGKVVEKNKGVYEFEKILEAKQ